MSKSETNPKFKEENSKPASLEVFLLGFRYCFEFRDSDFGFPLWDFDIPISDFHLFAFHVVTKNQVVGAQVKPAPSDHGMGPDLALLTGRHGFGDHRSFRQFE